MAFFRWGKRRKGRLLLLTALLVAVGVVSFGCVEGLQPVGWSGGVVSDGTLYVGSKEGRLVAINLTDESRQWSEPLKAVRAAGGFGCAPTLGGCESAPSGVAIYGTPSVYNDLVYFTGYNGKVYAFNAGTLATRWVYPREDNLKPIVAGTVVAQDKVFFGGSDGIVYALDAATGDPQWQFATGDRVWAAPAADGDTLFVGSFDNNLYALNMADGSLKWSFEAEGALASSPLVQDGVVYVGSLDRHLYAVNEADGSLKWKFMGSNWFWAKPVVYGGTVYTGDLEGLVYALRADNGARLAEFDLKSPAASEPVVVGSSVIVASKKGVVYAIDTELMEMKMLADVGGDVYGPLCASDGIVYIHTPDLTLHRINAITGAVLRTISLESGQ